MFRVDVAEWLATLNVTVPLPLPLAPPVIVIQLTFSVAVHGHPAGAATENVLVPPAEPSDRLAGDTVNAHPAAAWSTVTVCPATVSGLLLADVVELLEAENVTVPLPLPFAPPVIVIQLELSVAVHAHPPGATTENVLVPPVELSERVVGVTTKAHVS